METARERFERLNQLLQQDKELELKEWLATLHPADIADMIEALEEEGRKQVFGLLPPVLASDVLVEIYDYARGQVLEDMGKERLGEIFKELETDEAADIIADLPRKEARLILSHIPQEDSEEVQRLLEYGEDTAGGIMQTRVAAVTEGTTAREAVELVRRASEMTENLSNLYVVAEDKTLVGILTLSKLILTQEDTPISQLMEPIRHSVTTHVDQEEVARIFKKYNLLSLPVVDDKGRLMGQVVVDDIVDVIDKEAAEDMYRMGGLYEDERVLDSPIKSVRKRMPWAFVNLITAFLAASVVGFFTDTIASMAVIATFLPVVAGMGGNAGIQTLAVIIRGLAMGDLDFAETRKVLFKQSVIGLLNGITAGILAGIMAYYWYGKYLLGVVVGLAMTSNMVVATSVGTLIPLALRRLQVDPASGSGIFLTACTDAFGFFSYLGLATLFLRFLM